MLASDQSGICRSQFHCQRQEQISCRGNVSHNRPCLLNSLRTPGLQEGPGTTLSPSCMSGFDSFSEGLAFPLCNCNGFRAMEQIYCFGPQSTRSPVSPATSHDVEVARYEPGQRCWRHCADVMKSPYCLRTLHGAFCPEPCWPFKAQVAGAVSSKLTWKAVQGQRNGFAQLCLGPWAGGTGAIQRGEGPPNHLPPDPRRTKEKTFHH